jgi:hypothetical protein
MLPSSCAHRIHTNDSPRFGECISRSRTHAQRGGGRVHWTRTWSCGSSSAPPSRRGPPLPPPRTRSRLSSLRCGAQVAPAPRRDRSPRSAAGPAPRRCCACAGAPPPSACAPAPAAAHPPRLPPPLPRCHRPRAYQPGPVLSVVVSARPRRATVSRQQQDLGRGLCACCACRRSSLLRPCAWIVGRSFCLASTPKSTQPQQQSQGQGARAGAERPERRLLLRATELCFGGVARISRITSYCCRL